jgi:hypothetical protein
VLSADTLVDEVHVDLYVLMLHGIGGDVDRADVVVVHEGGAARRPLPRYWPQRGIRPLH